MEEPPRDTIFILICSTIGNLPITLQSRAIKLKFNTLSHSEIVLALSLFDVENAEILASISDGSIGDALYLYENNGIDLYQHLLKAFSSDYQTSHKAVRYIIENKLCDNFGLIKQLIIRVLKEYIDTLTGIKINDYFSQSIGKVSIDHETEKVLQIISNLNRGENLLLDKNGMIAEVFETFYETSEMQIRNVS